MADEMLPTEASGAAGRATKPSAPLRQRLQQSWQGKVRPQQPGSPCRVATTWQGRCNTSMIQLFLCPPQPRCWSHKAQ